MVANTDGFVENGAHRTRKGVFSEMARPCLYQTILTIRFACQIYQYFWWLESFADQIYRYFSWLNFLDLIFLYSGLSNRVDSQINVALGKLINIVLLTNNKSFGTYYTIKYLRA